MTTPSTTGSGTVAGRPQPQTTTETSGGPFIRHAPDGRRAQYVDTQQYGGFMSRPTVSMPGYAKGYRCVFTGTGGANAASAPTVAADAPWNFMQLVQMKDAFGTQLLVGPGYVIGFEVPLYSGQFGTDLMRTPVNSPQQTVYNTTLSASGLGWQFATYFAFEFAKAYGVISGANAALLPVLQINLAAASALFTANVPTTPLTWTETLDSDFYWLPSAPTDPPGLGTTAQWIYQPSNPTIPANASQLVQLPRMGGYLTGLILEIRDAAGLRDDTLWPSRPKILVDGVPLIDTLFSTLQEDVAINCGVGAAAANIVSAAGATQSGIVPVPRPAGTIWLSRKTSLAQRDFGLLDTGEIFLSTNPGTQLEVAGFPWGAGDGSNPHTLNATVGQVVPSGTIVQGLPEV
jgi:hypothetical protein